MLVNELKCIEVLMRYLINHDSNLDNEILSTFDNEDDFEKHRINLFNLISINNLINSFNEQSPFPYDEFFKTGIVPNIYPEKTATPSTGNIEYKNYKEFYNSLIEALKNNNYVFDNDNNIFVSSTNIEVTIPQIWLYRLSQTYKQIAKSEKYERVFFYKKNKKDKIKDKKDLLEYIRTAKTFLVKMTSSSQYANYERGFDLATDKVRYQLKGIKETKLDDIIDLFTKSVPGQYKVQTSKYRISEDFWLIQKAEQLGSSFYNKSLEEQESLLNKWIIERINCNIKESEEAQKYILLSNTKVSGLNINDLNKEEIIASLFALYVSIIQSLEQDLSSVSLSDFRIKTYMDEKAQNNKVDRRALDRQIKIQEEQIEESVTEAVKIFEEIKRLDLIENFDRITELRARYNDLTDEIERYKKDKNKLGEEKKSLNNVEDIAFDNEKIISLINEASIRGQIFVEGNDLVIQLRNSELSDPVFKVIININKLLNLIEDINLTFEDFGYSMR